MRNIFAVFTLLAIGTTSYAASAVAPITAVIVPKYEIGAHDEHLCIRAHTQNTISNVAISNPARIKFSVNTPSSITVQDGTNHPLVIENIEPLVVDHTYINIKGFVGELPQSTNEYSGSVPIIMNFE